MKKLISLFFLLSLVLSSCKNDKVERYTRKNIHSPEATEDIKALEKALSIMRKQDCSNPTSWYYQGAIHWVPDTIKNNQFCSSYHTYLEKKDGWDNCTHTHTSVDEINFLVWHRLYIWHFEKIVREISGKKDFALPYWGYTNAGSNEKALQSSFTDPSSALYESCRYDSLNKGYPIEGEVLRSFDLTKLMSYTSYELFGSNIDRAPHGSIHDYVGHGNDYNDGKLSFNNPITGTNTHDGLMGWVPTAAFDPIFWTHHSNIDRIWQKWNNSKNGQMVTLEQLQNNPWNYVFFDENGEKVIYTPEQIIDIIYTMDYDFDDCVVKPSDNKTLLKSKKNMLISRDLDCDVNSQITDAVTINLPVTYLKGSDLPKKVQVEIEVSFTKVPKGVYEVYVNLPENIRPITSSNSFVGFMTFFGADHKVAGSVCKNGCCLPLIDGRPSMKFKFEVEGDLSYNFKIYKHNGIHTGDLRVEKVSLLH